MVSEKKVREKERKKERKRSQKNPGLIICNEMSTKKKTMSELIMYIMASFST